MDDWFFSQNDKMKREKMNGKKIKIKKAYIGFQNSK